MIVKDVVDSLEANIQALYPEWKKLDYAFNIEKNHFRNTTSRFAVLPQEADFSDGVTRVVTVDHIFQVVLVTGFKNKSKNDFAQREALYDLYDKMENIAANIHAKKAGVPGSALLVTLSGYEEPEFLETDDLLAILRGNFIIKYRKSIT